MGKSGATATKVVVALGSNLGDRLAYLQMGLDAIAAAVDVTAVSSVYETAPVGGPPDQGAYLNAVVSGTTALTPEALLAACHGAEAAAERVRVQRWGPRTLDVDVIAMGDLVRDEPDPVLPHPRAHERAFVLLPWAEIDPEAALVGAGAVADLLLGVDDSGVRLRHDLRLRVASR